MKKKGIFFTLLAILFVDVFLIGSRLQLDYTYSDMISPVEHRVSAMDDFIDSLENDAGRGLYISGFRALVSMDNYVVDYGDTINVETVFPECMINGTIKANESYAPLMVNQTIPLWKSRMMNLSRLQNFTLLLNFSNLSVEQVSPWTIRLQMTINYTLTDDFHFASYNRTKQIITFIQIDNWLDPLYALKSGGYARAIINANNSQWNISSFKKHFESGTYTANPDAPSFLDRLEGKMDPDTYGIETIINPNDFGNPNNYSCVDYIFWNGTSTNNSKIHNITDDGYPAFYLDDEHVTLYNLNAEAY